jgi:RNase P/RNase MRP subunit p29
MKDLKSDENFLLPKKGRVFTFKLPAGAEVPVKGEKVLIDGSEKEVLSVETSRCVCGKCGLLLGLLVKE